MSQSNLPEKSSTVDPATALAQQRTELALERTLLAWVRTAFAFISAAVALNRLLVSDAAAGYFDDPVWQRTAWIVSVLLCCMTALLLLCATVQYVSQCRHIGSITDQPSRVSWPSLLASGLVIAMGVIAGGLILLIG
ncbi:MAG: DUF202 domain-containing protein [Pirellulaceae bacterium]